MSACLHCLPAWNAGSRDRALNANSDNLPPMMSGYKQASQQATHHHHSLLLPSSPSPPSSRFLRSYRLRRPSQRLGTPLHFWTTVAAAIRRIRHATPSRALTITHRRPSQTRSCKCHRDAYRPRCSHPIDAQDGWTSLWSGLGRLAL